MQTMPYSYTVSLPCNRCIRAGLLFVRFFSSSQYTVEIYMPLRSPNQVAGIRKRRFVESTFLEFSLFRFITREEDVHTTRSTQQVLHNGVQHTPRRPYACCRGIHRNCHRHQINKCCAMKRACVCVKYEQEANFWCFDSLWFKDRISESRMRLLFPAKEVAKEVHKSPGHFLSSRPHSEPLAGVAAGD